MSAPWAKLLSLGVAAVFVLAVADPALARTKKKPRDPGSVHGIVRDYDGTPIIMEGYRVPRVRREDDRPARQAEPRRTRPRGSSTLVPPPVPSPDAVPPRPLTQPPAVHNPAPIRSFGDRVTGCIHSYPLNAGIGNNPTDRQTYVRQCAN